MIQIECPSSFAPSVSISLPLSKSVFNRELILARLASDIQISRSEAYPDDINSLIHALYSTSTEINVGHAGTAMRFATAYYACHGLPIRLTGSLRMYQRPISILVEALRTLGANIQYDSNNGYPPLSIGEGSDLGGAVKISGSVSSQYASALLLVGASMNKGLQLEIEAPIVSEPYINLTCSILAKWGIDFRQEGNIFSIPKQEIKSHELSLEKDWSAAAFFYGLVAQKAPQSIFFEGLSLRSQQGDRKVAQYYEQLGVTSSEKDGGVLIIADKPKAEYFEEDLSNEPDLAQAILCTCVALRVPCKLSGLQTLLIKETNRIEALRICLEMIGIKVHISESSIEYIGDQANSNIPFFPTFEDHRMAMSLSILSPSIDRINIEDPEVVTKSFPEYWEEFRKLGFELMYPKT